MGDRHLPHDIEAERSVLGSVLVHNEALDAASELLTPEDFFRDSHRRLFSSMLRLSECGSAIDMVTLRAELQRMGDLDECGGPAYISALCDGVPRSTNVAYYAAIVKEQSRLRANIQIASTLLRRSYEATDSAESIATAGAESLELETLEQRRGGPQAVSTMITGAMDTIERAHQHPGTELGLQTGFADLDEMTAGFVDSNLILLGARPSVGKTAMACNIAQFASRTVPTLFFSLEMSKSELMQRLLASEAKIDSHRLRSGYIGEHEWGRISTALGSIAELKLWIDETPGISLPVMRSRARSLRSGQGLGLVIVDYLQLVRPPKIRDSRVQEVGEISRGLKGLAKELNVPVLALSQLSRGAEKRAPVLSDLREAGDLEQDADLVLFLHRADEDPTSNITELIIAKQRNGPTGVVRVTFRKEFVRFENLASGF